MAESLLEVKGICNEDIYVYDDASSEYDNKYIKEKIPNAKQIIVRESNLGADQNLYNAIYDFSCSNYTHMVVFDSDLLFEENILIFIRQNMCKTQGIMSVYNSCRHESIEQEDDIFVKKQSVGAAGLVLSKEIANDIIDKVPLSRSYDWDICKHVTKQGIKIVVSNESHVQHIGFEGYNNDNITPYEYGLNFIPNNTITIRHLLSSIEELIIYENSRKGFFEKMCDLGLIVKKTIKRAKNKIMRQIKGSVKKWEKNQ